MNKKFWADEIKRLYFEGYSLDQARSMVRKMMKEYRRQGYGRLRTTPYNF